MTTATTTADMVVTVATTLPATITAGTATTTDPAPNPAFVVELH
jgi:hypothetical protein